MEIEKRKDVLDVMKVLLYMAMGVCGFLLVDVYRNQTVKVDLMLNKMEQIESRIIRMEYELKLK